MKKFLLGIFAVVFALGMSAFTTSRNQKLTTQYYNDGSWETIDASQTCDPGTLHQCVVNIDGVDRGIYNSPSFSDPFLTNQP